MTKPRLVTSMGRTGRTLLYPSDFAELTVPLTLSPSKSLIMHKFPPCRWGDVSVPHFPMAHVWLQWLLQGAELPRKPGDICCRQHSPSLFLSWFPESKLWLQELLGSTDAEQLDHIGSSHCKRLQRQARRSSFQMNSTKFLQVRSLDLTTGRWMCGLPYYRVILFLKQSCFFSASCWASCNSVPLSMQIFRSSLDSYFRVIIK